MRDKTKLVLFAVLATGLSAAGTTFTNGVVLSSGMRDLRVTALSRTDTGDLFDRPIASKGMSYAAFFNGRTGSPSLTYPNPQADTDPDTLTRGEIEAGLEQWWSEADGDKPSPAELDEFDRVTGDLLSSRLYSLANPVSDKMLADGYSSEQVQAALIYQPLPGAQWRYEGLIFGASAVAEGMSFGRAVSNIRRGLGVDQATATGYLDHDYGEAKFHFYVQKKAPVSAGDVDLVRGDPEDASKYRHIESTVAPFRPAENGVLRGDLHPGTTEPVSMPEPFDPGAQDSQDVTLLRNTNMEIVAKYEGAAGSLTTDGRFYVENYRKVTQVDLEFTGALAGQTVPASRQVAEGLRSPNVLPYTEAGGGSATLELPDGPQVNAAFKAIAELGDGINGYVRYHSFVHDKDTVLYWLSPAQVPGGMTTRWGTPWRGPGLGPTSGEDPSLIEELIDDTTGLFWINPPAAMRAWLDPLLFDPSTGHPNRPQVVNALVKEAWNSAGAGGAPFGEYSPYAVCNTANGHIMKIPLKFDLADTSAEQTTSIFRPGDVVLPQNFTKNAPMAKLYENINASGIPPEKLPKDVKGNTIQPNGENLYLEASTCCGITSIIGGATVSKDDSLRPNGQISMLEGEGEDETKEFQERLAVTAGVPNDPRAAQNPVGEYHLLYPLSRIHEDLPVLPADPTVNPGYIQGTDAKLYGDYANDSPIFANAPAHPSEVHEPRSLANPVDALGFPFMSLHGPADKNDPQYQAYVRGHRYMVTLTAWDNLSPVILEPMPDRGIDGMICYPIRKMHYRLYRDGGETVLQGDVIPADKQAGSCVDVEPTTKFPWVPRAEGPHFWELQVEDLEGNTRTLLTQVDVTEDGFDAREIYEGSRRGGE